MSKKTLHNKYDRGVLRERLLAENFERTTLSFYNYVQISDPQKFRDDLYRVFDSVGVLGRIYVASEGVNGQISLPEHQMDAFKDIINTIEELKGIRLNIAVEDDGKSFIMLKIKVREKIVADGLDDASFDSSDRGKHLGAEAFNALTEDPETIVIDMRNHYESEVGKFRMAITPDVETFREALPIVEEMLEDKKDKNIIMYCTGGIRCEKASAYFKHKGFEKVHQVEGGIIEYTRQAADLGIENKFIGKNFVFDDRLGERISDDVISKCHQCGASCDTHVNCANDACHILFIQCDDCATKYAKTCSQKCKEFNELPEEKREELKARTEFNGTKCGKGRYKAHKKDEHLEL